MLLYDTFIYNKRLLVNMDKKDRMLIYELGLDARKSYSQLAKSTRMSQETVRYRINKLVEDGIIKKFIMFTNDRLLGYSFYQLFFKLQNVREKDKEEIIEDLKKNKNVAWIANLEGRFDVALIVIVRDQTELQEIVDELYKKFGHKIMQKALSFQLSADFFPRDYLIDAKAHIKKTEVYKPVGKKIKIDDIDMKICLELSQNARESFVNIGNKLKMSADAVAQRVKKLEKIGLITGYTLDIDKDKIGILHYKILLRLNNLSPEKTRFMLDKISSYNKVIALIRMLAEWDYEIDIEVENVTELKDFIMNLTTDFSEIIKDYDFIRIVDMPKYNFFPNVKKT